MRRRWRAAPLLVLAALAGLVFPGPVLPAVPSEADRLWLLGSGAFADGLHDVAYRELARFAEVAAPSDPRQGEAGLLRGKAAFQMARAAEAQGRAAEAQGRYGDALAAFEVAEQHPPPGGAPGEALFWQGEALLRLRRFDEAQARYARFLELDPRSPLVPEALYARGMAELELGHPEAALPPLLQLLRDHPGHERAATAGYSAARELIRAKRWTDALAILDGYASRYPSSPYLAETRYLLGVAQLETGRPEGVRTLEQFVAQSPDHELAPTARALVAEAHIEAGRLREALEQYQAMARAAPGHPLAPRALYRVGELALRLGRPADAEAAWTALRRQFPQDERAAAAGLATAELLAQRKQWDQALEVAQAVAARGGPERIPALLVLGQSALQLRRNVQAVQAYHSVTLEAPGDSPERFQGLAGLALASEVLEDLVSARRAYQEILQQSRDEKLLRWAQERLARLESREAPPPRESPRPRVKPRPAARPGSRS